MHTFLVHPVKVRALNLPVGGGGLTEAFQSVALFVQKAITVENTEVMKKNHPLMSSENNDTARGLRGGGGSNAGRMTHTDC